jgi:hypothetical protein
MDASALSSLVGAAAPGVAQGVNSAIGSYQQYQGDKAVDAMKNQENADPVTGDPNAKTSNMADANHPVWAVLNNLTGNPGNAALPGPGAPAPGSQGIPVPQMDSSQFPAAQMGAPIPAPNAQAPAQMQNGGVVKRNAGVPTSYPEFVKGPAIPTGPNASIVPASTEGQILTMDAGGVVPDGFHEQSGISGVPMSGRGAALVEGLQAGQNLGHNLKQAWDTNRARSAAADYAGVATSPDVNNPDASNPQAQQPSALDKAKNLVEGFFHHIHEGTLDDNHTANQPAPGSPNYQPPAAGVPTGPGAPGAGAAPPSGPALPAGAGPVPGGPTPGATQGPGPAGPPGGTPAPTPAGAPGQPPTGAGGPPPAAGAQPGAGPNVPAQPQPGQPQPVSDAQKAATVGVVKQVAGNPEVRSGVPDKTPEQSGLPHSLTPEYWAKLNAAKTKAVQAAAQAGEDPAKVYESLTAMQNAHFQGQILKQLGTANVAFQNGDMKAVKQALSNVNYYLPNGQGITFKDATAADAAADPTGSTKVGDPMYKNPFYGLYGHQNDPEYTKIDAQHIQQLGTAALDPTNVQKSMLESYNAQNTAHKENLTAQGAYMAGEGKRDIGAADLQNSNLKLQNAEVDRRLTGSKTTLNLAEAGRADREPVDRSSNGQPKVTQASIRARQNDVATYVDNALTGQQEAVPVKNADGSINLSTAAGKTTRNPAIIPSWGVGFTPEQRENVKILGGSFAAANPQMTKEDAAQMAARITRFQTKPTTHVEADGKRHVDFTEKDGVAHVWVGNGYKSFYTAPNAADETASPVNTGGGGSNGGSAEAPEGAHTGEMQDD